MDTAQPYAICSIAVDLKISQVVDVPNMLVSGFPARGHLHWRLSVLRRRFARGMREIIESALNELHAPHIQGIEQRRGTGRDAFSLQRTMRKQSGPRTRPAPERE